MANERRTQFIETAMKLFAEKGYHSTSIQDIVEAWGISKGAFYHHFSSKEDLMLSIVKHHFEMLHSAFMNVKQENESEKEMLVKQITLQFEGMHSHKHKEFVQMMMAEQLPKISHDIHQYLFKQRVRIFNWYCQRLIEVYGEKVEHYVFDVVTMLIGMIREYIFYILFNSNMLQLRSEEIARFIVRRLDAIVDSFEPHESPLLKKEMICYFTEIEERERRERKKQIVAHIARLKETLSSISLDKKTHHQLHSALDTLEAELTNEQSAPREYVVKGILLYIESQKIQPLSNDLASLTEIVHEYITNHK
ncbi:TetR/AcrR family transcriptional regulator [Thermaerobacillus caldiproteolyticus]|uniref:TetR/AcrR family transcriptional regulator n=1 Tax=Thermaerobacillus caldiproteolyticus TaxID=247480 RepID=UPI0018F2348B|nr:TetR/AcrR family transcriptional regulator [Anoxybacillus caldiproteolyticus]